MAERGETILISDRERIVAELGRRETRPHSLPDAILAEAVRKGLLTPPLSTSGPLPDSAPIAPLSKIVEGLAVDRTDRWRIFES